MHTQEELKALRNEYIKLRPLLRPIVMEKCNRRCVHCGTADNLQIDHILALTLGGNNDLSNLQILCSLCNAKKGGAKSPGRPTKEDLLRRVQEEEQIKNKPPEFIDNVQTRDAFLIMCNVKAVSKVLGVSRPTVSTWKVYAAEGKITTDKMEEMLLKYGATIVQEKLWKLPK